MTAPTTVMVLAAGEFGAEAVSAFRTLGARVIAVDGYLDAPGSRVADSAHVIDLSDVGALLDVVRWSRPDIVVCESAGPATSGLLEVDRLGLAEVVPSPHAITLTRDAEELRRFADNTVMVPTRSHAFAGSAKELTKAADTIGYPCVVRPVDTWASSSRKSVVSQRDEIGAAWRKAVADGGKRVMVEAHTEDAYEVTLLTARTPDPATGQFAMSFCTPIGHREESGEYVEHWQPQPMSTIAYDAATSVAARIVRGIGDTNGRGTFGVRLFVDGDDVRFSDVTPYPHDVGLLTTITQRMSEFEMRARAILGLPVDVTSSSPGASALISVPASTTTPLGSPEDAVKAPESGIREFTEPDSLRYGRLGLALATADNVVTARSRAADTAAAAHPAPAAESGSGAGDEPRKGGVQSLKVGAAAQMLPLVVGYGINLISTPFIVYKLGLHDFGIWAMTGAIAQYAALFDFGVSRAINRYVALFHAQGDDENERAVVGISLSVLTVLGTVLLSIPLLFPDLIERVLQTGDVGVSRHLVLAAVSMLICSLIARAFAASSFGRGRQVAPNIGLAILGVAQVLGGVIGLILTPTLESFATATMIGSGVGFVAVMTCILLDERRIVIGPPKAALAREVIAFGLKGQAVGAADIVNFQSGKLIAGFVVGPAAAGAYELGSRLAVGAQAFGGAASVALTTHLTRTFAASGLAGILPGYVHLSRRNAAVGVFLPFFLVAAAPSIIPFWLGERNIQVIAVVMAMGAAMAVNVSTGVCTATIFAIGRPGLIAAVSVLEPVVALVLSISLAMAFGFVGILTALAGWIALGAFLGVWFLQSRIGIPLRHYLTAVRGPFAVGLLAVVVTMPIGLLTAPDSRGSAFIPLAVGTLLFTGVYVIISTKRDYLPRLIPRKAQVSPAVADAAALPTGVAQSPEPSPPPVHVGRHRRSTQDDSTWQFMALRVTTTGDIEMPMTGELHPPHRGPAATLSAR